ncbi:MAG: signal peptidase I [Blastocatellia bacterium]
MFDFWPKRQFNLRPAAVFEDNLIEVHDFRLEARRGLMMESFRLIRDVFLILVVLTLIGVFFVQPVVVEGTSMLPMLHDGERLLVNKFVYYDIQSVGWGHLERGDVVVFWFPREPEKSYVKRIIGLPGETIEIREGRVFVDGRELPEPYIDPEYNRSMATFPPRRVDDHHYFVMGDNRDNSSDSRYWGTVPEKYIFGRAFFRYWKPSDVGVLTHADYPGEFPKTATEVGGKRQVTR